jgi:hypothetical protein
MRLIRRVALFAVDLNKIQTEALIRLYGRLGLYRKLYTACGLPEDVAVRIEQKMIDSMNHGVEEQHVLFAQWIKGESDLADFFDRYGDWFREYLERCSKIPFEELSPAA